MTNINSELKFGAIGFTGSAAALYSFHKATQWRKAQQLFVDFIDTRANGRSADIIVAQYTPTKYAPQAKAVVSHFADINDHNAVHNFFLFVKKIAPKTLYESVGITYNQFKDHVPAELEKHVCGKIKIIRNMFCIFAALGAAAGTIGIYKLITDRS